MTQPLLGSAPLPGQAAGPARRPRGQPGPDRDRPAERRRGRLAVQGRGHGPRSLDRAAVLEPGPAARPALELPRRPSSLAQEIVNREQAELVVGKGTIADVAEAAQRLEQFNLDLVTRTSDVITTERQLRNILGLPPADNRRIIPVTPPTEARLEPDWDTSLAQMLNFQPDIVQQQILVRVAELQLLIARNQLLPQLSLNALYQLNGLGQQLDSAEAVMTGATIKALEPGHRQPASEPPACTPSPASTTTFITWQVGFTFQMPLGMRSPLANTRQAQYILLRQRAYLQQIVHQTTHSLARFFLEIDANYKQFKTASRLRAAAAQRLDAQRAYYEEGRITIDRFLDAVSQYATAVATEAQYKTTYNISIVALEEAKGTLLAYDNIAVAEGPHPRKAYIQARDIQNAHRKLPIPPDGPMYRPPVSGPIIPDPVPDNPPPDVKPGDHPPLPAPAGPLGPAPVPLPPYRPAGEAPIITRNSGPAQSAPATALAPAADSGPGPASPLPDHPRLDGSTLPVAAPATPLAAPAMSAGRAPAAIGPLPTAAPTPPAQEPPSTASAASPASGPPPAASRPSDPPDDLPELPAEIDLPPLPK